MYFMTYVPTISRQKNIENCAHRSCYKLKFHLGQKYAKNEIRHTLLKGDVTDHKYIFTDHKNKVIITHTKNGCLKTQGS